MKIKFEILPYDRNGKHHTTVTIEGKTVRSCLLEAFDCLNLYEDAEDVLYAEINTIGHKLSDKELIEKMIQQSGDKSDYILAIINLENSEYLYIDNDFFPYNCNEQYVSTYDDESVYEKEISMLKRQNQISAYNIKKEDKEYCVTLEHLKNSPSGCPRFKATIIYAPTNTSEDTSYLYNAVYTFTGSQLKPGTSANSFTYTAKNGTDITNYVFEDAQGRSTVIFGDLKVNKTKNWKIVAALHADGEGTGTEKTVKYDGTTQSVSLIVKLHIESEETKNTVEDDDLHVEPVPTSTLFGKVFNRAFSASRYSFLLRSFSSSSSSVSVICLRFFMALFLLRPAFPCS